MKFNSNRKGRSADKGHQSVGKILKTVWSPEEGWLRWSPKRGDYIDNDQALVEEERWQKNLASSSQKINEIDRSRSSSKESPRAAKPPSSHRSLERFLETLRNQRRGTDSQD